ncbi:septum site-determining protein MinC [Burkholderia orbicola]|uniref:Probable septum site-determining protein MinC n=4 Tax=Burkholderia cepacia complex TaxID=87882 RepID=MINC_BURCH|nr:MULTISPECIES: septum site-determining protein MinC [Burkholderia]A0K5F9.1 RecName: Full=Probable septum site-determining protein MinC [Burkholderia cenocepacia HI2424]Q1BY89.1 RecName: Full=Probable septum site-determining protein MinC [Burkholderia orbicola AU 1054]EKS9840171.1 septum site-determining protein MinC [Burkholderia cepacia]ESS40800.1 Septum site-determining protein MinC [Burkholderia cenocepacia KC-01]BEV54191.1 septum site-determining protein MinC [Burkholderia contaminans]A
MSLKKSPFFELRSGSVDTLLFTVKTTDLDALRAELVKRFEATPEFFADDVVAIDVRRLADGERVALADIRQMLNDVRMRPVGVVALATQGWAGEAGLPLLEARDRRAPAAKPADEAEPAAVPAVETAAAPAAAAAPEQPSEPAPTLVQAGGQTLVIDRPLRSGQQIYAKGDLVVLAPVSHGAEIIAEGNIHIYAPLRGRALAGVHGNHDARIFCTCLEPELISIAGIYRTTENPLPADVLGKSVQIRLEEEKLMIEPLRLT